MVVLSLLARRLNRKPHLLYVHGYGEPKVGGFHRLPNALLERRADWLTQ